MCGLGPSETGADSVNLIKSSRGGGVGALDSEGEEGVETPNERSCRRCSDFCFFRSLSASISALLASLACKLPLLVEAPAGRAENQDMDWNRLLDY